MIPGEVLRNPWVRSVFFLGLVSGVLMVGYLIWDIIMLFMLAFFFAYLLDPAADWVEEQLQVGRVTSVVILLVVITLFTVLLGYFLTTQVIVFTQQISEMEPNIQKIADWITAFLPPPFETSFELFMKTISSEGVLDFQKLADYLRDNLASVSKTLEEGSFFLLGFARQTLGGVIGVTVNVMVLIFVTIYFLRDFDQLIFDIRKLIPHPARPGLDELFKEVDGLLRAFFRGHLIVCLTIGILYGTGYLILGLEGGFLVGFLSGLMNVIPYVGPTLGFLLAVVLGLFQFGLSIRIAGIVLVFVLVQSLEGNVLTPNIVGGAVGLNPVTVIFSLMVFGKFFGFIGLLLAIPSAGILKVILTRFYRYYRSTEFYRGTSERPS